MAPWDLLLHLEKKERMAGKKARAKNCVCPSLLKLARTIKVWTFYGDDEWLTIQLNIGKGKVEKMIESVVDPRDAPGSRDRKRELLRELRRAYMPSGFKRNLRGDGMSWRDFEDLEKCVRYARDKAPKDVVDWNGRRKSPKPKRIRKM